MFWTIVFFFYLLAVTAVPFVLFFSPQVGIFEIVNFLVALLGLAPLYGLAFRRRLMVRAVWVGYFALNLSFSAYMAVTVWYPSLRADAGAFLSPGNLIALVFLACVLYGQYRYAFRSMPLWARPAR